MFKNYKEAKNNYRILQWDGELKNMKFKKGQKLIFKNRTEVIIKASNDVISGIIKTDKQKYSVDFLKRWLHFGFVKLQ